MFQYTHAYPLLFPRDAWSMPLDMVQARLHAQSERGQSVEGGRAARLSLDLTPTQVPIAQLYEADFLCDALLLS
jgi:hypothetical protein